MRLDISQNMKMDQRMALAPRMIQSMEILQLPLQALEERIEQELISNPVLELDERQPSDNGEQIAHADDDDRDSERTLTIRDDNSKREDFTRLESIGEDYGDYLARSTYNRPRRNDGEPDRKLEAMQNTAARAQSLNEHLHEQWAFVEAPRLIKKAGAVIIDFIEETGYLNVDLHSLEEYVREPVTAAQMREALALVQTLEPAGVGSRNLSECLALQLRAQEEQNPFALEVVTDYLKDLEMNRLPQIAKKSGRPLAEVQEAVKVISRLDPRPGMQVGRHEASYVVPDIIVDYDEDHDQYVARLADGSLPSLRLNADYTGMLRRKDVAGDTKDFLTNSVRSARWLIESIQQRKATLLRVVNHVLQSQRDFFDHGPAHLKPLPMVDVADKLGIHVGTVSRAVSGKYMQTPIGIFPLRSFFSGGTETTDGESMSWDAVKAKLQEIIDNEDKANPLNDDELVAELGKHGITVARRTVAKYRGLLSIPTARRRRQYA